MRYYKIVLLFLLIIITEISYAQTNDCDEIFTSEMVVFYYVGKQCNLYTNPTPFLTPVRFCVNSKTGQGTITVEGQIILTVQMTGESLSKYPDVYQAQTFFKGSAAFIGPHWKSNLKLDGKYLDVKIQVFHVENNGEIGKGGVYIYSPIPGNKGIRGVALLNNSKLKDLIFNLNKERLTKAGCPL